MLAVVEPVDDESCRSRRWPDR